MDRVEIELKGFSDHVLSKNAAMDHLMGLLDEAIDEMEQGRVQTIEEAWKDIDQI